jgi:hypothetical protein
MVRAETDPSALTRHLGLLRGRFEATRSALAELVAEFGWTPGGPCGGSCDWPTCRAERSECVRYRSFQQTLAGELRRRQGAEPKKWYVQVWHRHHAPDEPYETVSEIGADGHELRKVAYFDDEHAEWADTSGGIGTLVLSGEPVPPFVELAARDDCWAEEITPQHFEEWWAKAQADPRRSFLPEQPFLPE